MPSPPTRGAAWRSERSTAPRETVSEALEGAEIVFCAGPVGSLPALVAEALGASGPDAVVTDVGSTKRELIAGAPRGRAAERFIGGHPVAGAESAGVENARDDLFEGAALVPDADRALQRRPLRPAPRAIADLGARPQAIDPETHDRLHGDGQPPPARDRQRARRSRRPPRPRRNPSALPEVGPSFRDTTRVAGANPAIWGDIFATNSEAVARRDRGRGRAAARGRGGHSLG